MIIKKTPINASTRNTFLIKKNQLDNFFEKEKKRKKINSNGKNNQGKITIKHRGGGHKKLFRQICFNRKNEIINGFVKTIVYDPQRSANLAGILIQYNLYLYEIKYILAPSGLKKNMYINTSSKADFQIGNALPLYNIPIGSIIHNISIQPFLKSQYSRSAGTFAQLIQKIDINFAKIRFRSGIFRLISLNCFATLGFVSNIQHKLQKKGKAGRNRWLNKRPHVRGVAKNPVDHPHGGGEGKTSGGRPSVTPSGIITKGKPTKKKKLQLI